MSVQYEATFLRQVCGRGHGRWFPLVLWRSQHGPVLIPPPAHTDIDAATHALRTQFPLTDCELIARAQGGAVRPVANPDLADEGHGADVFKDAIDAAA